MRLTSLPGYRPRADLYVKRGGDRAHKMWNDKLHIYTAAILDYYAQVLL
jgi:hypothetical protein